MSYLLEWNVLRWMGVEDGSDCSTDAREVLSVSCYSSQASSVSITFSCGEGVFVSGPSEKALRPTSQRPPSNFPKSFHPPFFYEK